MKSLFNKFNQNKVVSGSTYLTLGQLGFNAIGYVSTILMSRVLTVEDYGVLAVLSSFFFLIGIPAGALGQTVQRYIAYLWSKDKSNYVRVRKASFRIAFLMALLANSAYILAIPFLSEFLQLNSLLPLVWFAPVIGSSFILYWYKSFLKGHLAFGAEALFVLFEGLIKLAVVALTLIFNWGLVGAISAFWVSIILSLSVSWLYVERYFPTIKIKTKAHKKAIKIKGRELIEFYLFSVFSQLGLMILLSVDIILVKHLTTPEIAGKYALLSIFGKIIVLGATSLTGALTPLIARDSGSSRARKNIYLGYFLLSGFLTTAILFFSFFSEQVSNLVLGEKGTLIHHLLPTYSLAIAMVTLGLFTIQANIQQKRLTFAVIPNVFAFLLAYLLYKSADNTATVVNNYLLVASLFAVTSFLWFLLTETYIWYKDIHTFLGTSSKAKNKHQIMFLNWRDTQHVWAGGAEVYIHELAKRFVKKGHSVIMFAGNDKKSASTQKIDGIKIVRRGGFYTVYVWAFIYYIVFFRKRTNVIIDCENGIPFFTPIYSSLPKFLVVHHVHQEVFREHLSWPKAKLAQFLEGKLMPLVYRKVPLITVSESSLDELTETGIAPDESELVHCGVDLKNYVPGEKSLTPMVLYVGRLKAYKSLHILIKAAELIKSQVKEVTFVIAGDGEEKARLEQLVKKLKLTQYFTFVGKVSESQKLKLYQNAWVVVNPSFMEGFGITSIEANACGSVMVASDVPGLRDSVKDGYSGMLVPYGDISAFAEAITHLLKNDQVRKRMEKYALSWSQRYSWDRSSNKFLNLIKQYSATNQKPNFLNLNFRPLVSAIPNSRFVRK